MEMRVAVGSTRPAKVNAVKQIWEQLSDRMTHGVDDPAGFFCYDVPTDAPKIPKTSAELSWSVLSRVDHLILQLKRERSEADFYVGLEEGFNVIASSGARRQVVLESWVYVSDGLNGHFGHGNGISVPAQIADPVIDRGIELEIVIDRFCRARQLQSGQEGWKLLSQELLNRNQSYALALTAAFAPFYNTHVYG